ncbi:MAG TPA: permease prefix domain 1-containing protein [Symbiobacteriaceae bacterium]|jgi:ribose/xylose/arabinose/galactoside ABC-type transport system permease subunit
MWADDYLRQATAQITDPVAALAACRELKEHLEEARDELVARGIDLETAEVVAITRMGPPEALAVSLAEVHHRHLSWRLYLAPLPIVGLLVSLLGQPIYLIKFWWLNRFWLALLLLCVAPGWATLHRLWVRVRIDVRAKWRWLQDQPMRAAVASGTAMGGVAGMIWGSLPAWGRYNPFVLPLVTVGALTFALLIRWAFKGTPMLTAVFAAMAFALVSPPAMMLARWPGGGWIEQWFIFSGIFAFAALAIGWLVQSLADAKVKRPSRA